MSTLPLSRAAAFAAALLVFLLLAASSGAPAAQADNCQPEELVYERITGDADWESPVAPDESDPRCVIAAQLGCPNQADPAGCSNGIRTTAAGRDSNCIYSAGLTNAVRAVVCKANYMVPYLG
jgi:hypothetical protein